MTALPLYKRFPPDTSVETVCASLGVGRSSAYASAGMIRSCLHRAQPKESAKPCDKIRCGAVRERDFEIELLRYELNNPGCRKAGVRIQFDPAYKAFVEDRRAHYGLINERVSQILSIPLDTLKKFPRFVAAEANPAALQPQELPGFVIELANEYLRSGRRGAKSVKCFCDRNPELLKRLAMNYRQCLHWLNRLGFVSLRGIFLKNKGLDKILRFKPNHVWGSDGKRIQVIINGQSFDWIWQCLMDGATTVIVGGVINREENTDNLLTAIKESKSRTGIAPLAIVLDNRLSENLPAIRSFLDEMNTEIIKIFPGNSKSNGNVEGNFNIFDRWVGKIEIKGATVGELSRSIAEAFVEVFTQMRNHRPRKALSYKSVQEIMDETKPATSEEEAAVREKIKALADRFKNEQSQPIVSAEKKVAIAQAAEKTNPPHRDVFDKTLQNPRYTSDMIIGATAIWEQKCKEQPEKNYGHAYYGGILRRLGDQRAVEELNPELESVYAHHWETMGKLREQDLAGSLKTHPEATCTRLASDFMKMPIPGFTIPIMHDLKKSFLVASQGSVEQASHLRKTIAGFVVESKKAPRERRENLLCKLFEWENFVRMSAPTSSTWTTAPAGNA
jgi:hypothetical protein